MFEHITTREAAQYVHGADRFTAATITAHHLLFNRNAIFTGGIRPHYYCLPVLKREVHRLALVEAATSGSSKFFLGTDSAPHPAHLKEHASGCAGCYTAHAAMELYAEAFDSASALDRLEGFASFHGPAFYGLPRNSGTITLRRESWTLPESYRLRRGATQTPALAARRLTLEGWNDRNRRMSCSIDADNLSSASDIDQVFDHFRRLRRHRTVRRAYGDTGEAERHQGGAAQACGAPDSSTSGQEHDRLGAGHRRDGPAAHEPARDGRDRLVSDADFAPLVVRLREKGMPRAAASRCATRRTASPGAGLRRGDVPGRRSPR